MTATEKCKIASAAFRAVNDEMQTARLDRDAAIAAAKVAYDNAVANLTPRYKAAWNDFRDAVRMVEEEETAQTDSSLS